MSGDTVRRFVLCLCAVSCLPLGGCQYFSQDARNGRVVAAGRMTTLRVMHSATLLADGKVLLAGGSTRFRSGVLASAELFDPATNTFTPTEPMHLTRTKHAAALLPGGQVLIVGGTDDASELSGAQASAEVYDPARRAFTLTGPMDSARFATADGRLDGAWLYPTVTPLADGRVLITGGYDDRMRVTAGVWLYQRG